VISIASWVVNYDRIIALRVQYLGLTASLKAAQLSSNLDLMQRSVRSLSTRVKLQTALNSYNNGTNSTATWTSFASDMQSALTAPGEDVLTLQMMVFPNEVTMPGLAGSLLNVTGGNVNVQLLDGSYLGEANGGYPPNLYPNLTLASGNGAEELTYFHYNEERLDATSAIFLGPMQTNNSFALSSITLPVLSVIDPTNIIGFMTVVLDSRLIFEVVTSPVGLGETGVSLLLGPAAEDNEFAEGIPSTNQPFLSNDMASANSSIRFLLAPDETYNNKRHGQRAWGQPDTPFALEQFPAVERAVMMSSDQINNAGGIISTKNEQGIGVSVGYAIPQITLVDWVYVVEESKGEVWTPIVQLRKVLLACVFGTALFIILLVLPVAHYASRPIRRLRDATEKSIVRMDSVPSINKEKNSEASVTISSPESTPSGRMDEKTGMWLSLFTRSHRPDRSQEQYSRATLSNSYPIPETVQTRRMWIQDELSDLTQYFNEMSDELVLFYGKLEERVRQRTAESETAKKAAETANESKTLFIANISHELKTPLNGILGMCAVCLQENDPTKVKRSLEIIYKSGELLHNLLTDLLTFSKNQTGKIQLAESEFPLRDIGTQVKAIFSKQAQDNRVNFSISYEGCRDALGSTDDTADKQYGPPGTGRVKDMMLWGDMQRILQICINLVSNSLKFTPQEGTVSLKIRVLDHPESMESLRMNRSPSRRSSAHSKTSKTSKKYPRLRILSRSDSDTSPPPPIEPRDGRPQLIDAIGEENRSRTSVMSDQAGTAPYNTHKLYLEFVVEDTGPGIRKDLQEKIFEAFVQGDLRLTKKFGGTGLGLSICRQLATLMHGSVSLESTEGAGSKFTLHIPLKLIRARSGSNATSIHEGMQDSRSRRSSHSFGDVPKTATPKPTDAANTDASPPSTSNPSPFSSDSNTRLVGLSQPYFSTATAPMASPPVGDAATRKGSTSSRLRVLVAEDNKVNQEVVVRMLRLEEIFDVHVAKDGQEALDRVKESMATNTPYDLIFMDVQMPNLDGRESTREIRKMGYGKPIVALTAFADEINRKECIESGMSDFMAKPIKRPMLKSMLKQYCPPPPIEEEDEAGEHRPNPTAATNLALSSETDPFGFVGEAAGLKHERTEIEAISPATMSVPRPGLGAKDAGNVV